MQLAWLTRGLRTGVVTTHYPAHPELQPGRWRGRPVLDPAACAAADGCAACVEVCLPAALRVGADGTGRMELVLDLGRCVMCGLCVPACPPGALEMRPNHELAVSDPTDLRTALAFGG